MQTKSTLTDIITSQHTNSDIKSQLTDKRFHSLILTVSLHSTCGVYSQTTDKLFLLILLSFVNRQPFSFTDIVGLLQSLILTVHQQIHVDFSSQSTVVSLHLSVYSCQSTNKIIYLNGEHIVSFSTLNYQNHQITKQNF